MISVRIISNFFLHGHCNKKNMICSSISSIVIFFTILQIGNVNAPHPGPNSKILSDLFKLIKRIILLIIKLFFKKFCPKRLIGKYLL